MKFADLHLHTQFSDGTFTPEELVLQAQKHGLACIALTEGEIMQGRLRRNPSVTVGEYHEIIARKTACLFQAGARIAAHVAVNPQRHRGVLGRATWPPRHRGPARSTAASPAPASMSRAGPAEASFGATGLLRQASRIRILVRT